MVVQGKAGAPVSHGGVREVQEAAVATGEPQTTSDEPRSPCKGVNEWQTGTLVESGAAGDEAESRASRRVATGLGSGLVAGKRFWCVTVEKTPVKMTNAQGEALCVSTGGVQQVTHARHTQDDGVTRAAWERRTCGLSVVV